MKTDSLFYRLFSTLPELFFTLTGLDYPCASYQFKAVEVKQTAFRLDGVFIPLPDCPQLPIIFVEVQFQPDNTFYTRVLSEAFLYLNQYQSAHPYQIVVIFPDKKTETDTFERHAALIKLEAIQRIYLTEIIAQNKHSLHFQLLELIVVEQKKAEQLAKALVKTLAFQEQSPIDLLDLIETIITYKFSHLTRDEVRKMLHIPDINLDIRTTRFYQDVFTEGESAGLKKGKLEGKLEGEIEIITRLLNQRLGKLNKPIIHKIKKLDLQQIENLTAVLLDFKKIEALANWLEQQKQQG